MKNDLEGLNMKKHLIVFGIIFVLLIICFSGCINIDENEDNNDISIIYFKINPGNIKIGQTANLSWNVVGADIVSINNGIGNIELSGYLNINPNENKTYVLTASKDGENISETISIIVDDKISTLTFSNSNAGNQTTITVISIPEDIILRWYDSIILINEVESHTKGYEPSIIYLSPDDPEISIGDQFIITDLIENQEYILTFIYRLSKEVIGTYSWIQ